jgi:hypothetical protein
MIQVLPNVTRVYPKHSGLVSPSIQRLWLREEPVYFRTTTSSESVCQVARSWVDVGCFHTRLVLRLMIFTASVRNILDMPSYIVSTGKDFRHELEDPNIQQHRYDRLKYG